MSGKKPSQSATEWEPNCFGSRVTFPLTSIPLGFSVLDVASKEELSRAAQLLGRRGGMASTKAKVAAAQKNGKKGGRPKRKTA